jgi:tyrosinase
LSGIRRDVWNLTRDEGEWPAALVAYEQAVGQLRQLDPAEGKPENPLGWRFLAAIHGIATPAGRADTSNSLWCNCQHGSWYFLPWHRMYLRAFELIVQNTLGDENWSLPYWYSIDPDDPERSVLPPAFRDTTRAGNNLFTDRRSIPANNGELLPDLSASLMDALDAREFSSADGLESFGSGERSTPSFNGDETGLLEDTPHGGVHVLVGNDYDSQGNLLRQGWMGSFFTAALDPVFWLHHANIDRLWQVWLDLDPNHRNPTGDPAWFDSVFSFPTIEGAVVKWKVGDVLDTEALGYEYESTAPPSGVTREALPVAASESGSEGTRSDMAERPIPQVLGATSDVPIAPLEPIEVELVEPVDVRLARDAESIHPTAGRVYLRIEGVTGTAAAPVYHVYVNLLPGEIPEDHVELRAGSLSTFGIIEASQHDDLHDGGGKTVSFDITSLRDRLTEEGRWQPDRLQVSFVPVAPARPRDAGARGDLETMQASPSDLRASRIVVIAT